MIEQRKAEIRNKVAEIIAIGEQKFGVKLPPIDVRFDLRGRAAGQACYRGNYFYLRFNIQHIALGGKTYDHLLNFTVSHELAHSFCQANPQFGRNHDAGWKRVCLALGGNGRRCYGEDDAPEAVAASRPYVYITTAGHEIRVTKIMHTKIQRGGAYTVRGKGSLNRNCEYNYMTAPAATKPVVVKTPAAAPKERQVAAGGQSNAALIRARIALAKRQAELPGVVVQYAVQVLGMSLSLAKTYVKNNWNKV